MARMNGEHRLASRASVLSRSTGRATLNRAGLSSPKYGSRSSLASTGYRSSPPVPVRTAANHRRVIFNHSRKGSTDSPQLHSREGATSRNGTRREATHEHESLSHDALPEYSSSPLADKVLLGKAQKNAVTNQRAPLQVRKPRVQSHLFKEEARKVSTELEKYCEEAFRSSSSLKDCDAANKLVTDGDHRPTQGTMESSRVSSVQRPLPAPPTRAYDSFTERQLRETRDRLKQRSVEGTAGASQAYLDEVIAHLDRLMQPIHLSQGHGDDGRRAASEALKYTSPAGTGYLPVIAEEGRQSNGDHSHDVTGHRAASAPISSWLRPVHKGAEDKKETIRVVQQTAQTGVQPIAPLNVRKRSDFRAGGAIWEDNADPSGALKETNGTRAVGSVEEKHNDGGKSMSSQGKKFGWFKRKSGGALKEHCLPAVEQENVDVAKRSGDQPKSVAKDDADVENGERNRKTSAGKKGLLKLFGKRDAAKEAEKTNLRLSSESEIFLDKLCRALR